VLATGETHSVREFIELSFKQIDMNIEWSGKDENEVGKDSKSGKVIVEIDKNYFRPTEVDLLIGDASKAEKILGWKPKVTFNELVKIMVEADCEMVQKKGY
ncbi:MAG: GDP-mannose 4,6-dehydratase, partial [bacterium]